jgi:hypothetical protein
MSKILGVINGAAGRMAGLAVVVERLGNVGTREKKVAGLGARQDEGGGWMRAFRSWP